MRTRALSPVAKRRRRIMAVVDTVLGAALTAGAMIGVMAFFGWLAELAGRVF